MLNKALITIIHANYFLLNMQQIMCYIYILHDPLVCIGSHVFMVCKLYTTQQTQDTLDIPNMRTKKCTTTSCCGQLCEDPLCTNYVVCVYRI